MCNAEMKNDTPDYNCLFMSLGSPATLVPGLSWRLCLVQDSETTPE